MAVETIKVDLLERLRGRIASDPKSLYILVTGGLGEGKSWTSLSLCSGIDPSFTEDKEQRIVFNPVDFVVTMANREVPEGSMIMWDEAQTSMNPRKHMTAVNVALNTQLDTMRRDNVGLVLNCPTKIDKDVMRKLDFEVECLDIDKGVRKNIVKFKEIEHDKNSDDLYKKYPRVTEDRIIPEKMNPLLIPAPDNIREENTKELIEYYERERDKFQDKITKGVVKTIVESYMEDYSVSPEELGLDLEKLGLKEKESEEKKELKKNRIKKALKETNLPYEQVADVTGSILSHVQKIGRKVDRDE